MAERTVTISLRLSMAELKKLTTLTRWYPFMTRADFIRLGITEIYDVVDREGESALAGMGVLRRRKKGRDKG